MSALPSTVHIAQPVYHVELIDGQEVEKPLPKKLHIWIQSWLIIALAKLLPEDFMPLPECNTLTGGRTVDGRREYIIPDLVVVAVSARYDDGDLAEAPILGVEILSPGQTIGELFARAQRLLKLGCPLAWVIWPEKRRAWELSAQNLTEATSVLAARLPEGRGEIQVPLAEMWVVLDRK